MEIQTHGLLIEAGSGPGILHRITGVIAEHSGDIGSVSILENTSSGSRVYFEVTTPSVDEMVKDLRALPVIRSLTLVQSMDRIFGKRIIIMGGGAQVGQVA